MSNHADLFEEASLPAPRATASPFLRTVVVDGIVHLSGQLPYVDGRLEVTGCVGDAVTIEQGQEAARLCALNALAALVAEIGTLARVRQVVRLTGYVAAAAGFAAHPKVIDGASRVLLDYLGDRGRHARTAIGVHNLPHDAPVEVDLVVAVDPAAR